MYHEKEFDECLLDEIRRHSSKKSSTVALKTVTIATFKCQSKKNSNKENIIKMFNKLPKRTGIYHIKDGIENLELKVSFRHINSLIRLPKFDYNKNISTNVQQKFDINNYDQTEVKEVSIKWQEKLFSASEEELFKESKNCVTEIQKKYHDCILEKAEAKAELGGEMGKESSNKRRRKRRQKKLHNVEHQVKQGSTVNEIHTYIDEDNFQPKDGIETTRSGPTDAVVHMYIYAMIDVDTQLAHLQWYQKERMLYVYPDFNSLSHNPYFIEIDKDYRHLYTFALENISKTLTAVPGGDLSLYLELPELKPQWRTEEERNSVFAMPPKRTRRVSLLLELVAARNFQNDNIHVRYRIHLPANSIHEEGLLEASTHSSSMSDSGLHHLGHNWQLTLLCEENYCAGDFLHIYFEVISIDSWERERIEGYAFFAVNLLNTSTKTPAIHRLQCQRPVDSLWTAVERFFIGGRRKFDFVRFFGHRRAPDTDAGDVDSEFYCRYGCRMQSTGTLEFSCQLLSQRNCELLEPCKGRKGGMTLDDIMQAYREARNRLETLSLKK